MNTAKECGRFAPSITGSAHPGTLLAALLSWLDARSRGAEFVLRLEDLDTARLKTGQRELMVEALEWLGIDWDHLQVQSELYKQHEEILDALASEGLLYPCECSRRQIKERSALAPDSSFSYDNRCQSRLLPISGWRSCTEPLRVRLPSSSVTLLDESGLDLSQSLSARPGDPIVVRRDGAFAYHLVVVIDDAKSLVTRIVRGRDLATSTATQVQLQSLLGYDTPNYRHHFLLLERSGEKLAKLHKSLPFEEIRVRWTSQELCGILAKLCGIRDELSLCTPKELLSEFDWEQVTVLDAEFVR